MSNMITLPPLPNRWVAMAGGTKPDPASSVVKGKSKARAPIPKAVASVNGILK